MLLKAIAITNTVIIELQEKRMVFIPSPCRTYSPASPLSTKLSLITEELVTRHFSPQFDQGFWYAKLFKNYSTADFEISINSTKKTPDQVWRL
jgi:hypothetical protein